MKYRAIALVFAGLFMATGIAYADDFIDRRIAECIEDNTDAQVSTATIKKYCLCMSNKMGNIEAQSVTQWEKTHPVERAECDRESGWK